MTQQKNIPSFIAATLVAVMTAGCSTPFVNKAEGITEKSSPAATSSGPAMGPGMNDRGEVVDSRKVEMGHGRKVKGVDDYEGEVVGKPAPGTKFNKVQMGMELERVVEMLGEPSAKGTRMSATMFNPFYFGADKYKRELVYKGMGRLVFGERGGYVRSGGGNLIWIIHNAKEEGEK